MYRGSLLLLLGGLGLALAAALPVLQGSDNVDMDYLLRNISALWKEVNDLRHEVDHHLHHDHTEDDHDKVMREVGILLHEHQVHNKIRPHEGHNPHHNTEMLQHLETVHGHSMHDPGHDLDDHSQEDQEEDSGEQGDGDDHETDHVPDVHDQHGLHALVHGHDHSHDHEHDHDHGHGHEHNHLHDHEHEHDHDHGHGHEHDHLHAHGHGPGHEHHHLHEHEYGHGHEHDHEHGPGHEHDHLHDHGHEHDHDHGHGHEHCHLHDDEHGHGHERDRDGPVLAPRRGLALIPGRRPPQAQPEDLWTYASCQLKPNVDLPESAVRGAVIISQRRDRQGPVYFDMHLTGFDVSGGRVHGFHVHESRVTDGSCATAGGHFNPQQVTHGGPTSPVRHVGDLGNIEVDEDGDLEGYILSDTQVALTGENSIISKAIVIHAGVDDLGLGGDSGSLTTGNAGGRLACCNVYIQPDPHFRFKG